MNKNLVKGIFGVGFCSFIIMGTALLLKADVVNQLSAYENQLTQQELEKKAQETSVKILIGETQWGTGILVKKEIDTYIVVTNYHVLIQIKPPYRIQTSDGEIYQAKLLERFDETDLALLEFKAEKNYLVAHLKPAFTLAGLVNDTEVFAAGYPVEASKGFVMASGKIAALLPQPMVEGYQIGFYADIEAGMSGGALLNLQGEVVGIIGRSSYPINGYPRAYQFDNLPTDLFPEQLMLDSSWAIPIEIVASSPELDSSQDLAWNIVPSPTNPVPPNSAPNIFTSSEQQKPIVQKSLDGKLEAKLYKENNVYLLEIADETGDYKKEIKLDYPAIDKNMQLEDLDNDGEIEVIVNFQIDNVCPKETISYIIDNKNNYSSKNFPMNRGFSIEDLDGDNQLEIKTFDESFACQFASEYQSQEQVEALPIKIWKYKDGSFEDVTLQKKYLQAHEAHAKKIYKYYEKNKSNWQNNQDELKAILAAYLASKYLIGEGKDGWDYLKNFYILNDKEKYFERLTKLLKDNNYIDD